MTLLLVDYLTNATFNIYDLVYVELSLPLSANAKVSERFIHSLDFGYMLRRKGKYEARLLRDSVVLVHFLLYGLPFGYQGIHSFLLHGQGCREFGLEVGKI